MGEGGFQTRAYRRERLSACNIAYRRADTWVRPYGWSRAHPSPARQWRAGCKPAPTGGNGCPPATLPTGGRTRGSAPTAGHSRIPLPPVNGGRVQTRAYRRERLSACNIAYRRADTWVRPYGWSRAHPSPARQGGGSNPRLQAGTAVRQHHRLPAGGHVGPPLRLVTRASPSRPSMEGGFKPAPTGGNGCPPATLPTGGRTRGSAPTAGHARILLPPVKGGRGVQTRAYRRERLSASNIAYRRADTWVRPYGWSRAHPSPARQGRAGFKPAPTGGNGCPPAPSPTGGRTHGSAPTAGHARIPLPGGRAAGVCGVDGRAIGVRLVPVLFESFVDSALGGGELRGGGFFGGLLGGNGAFGGAQDRLGTSGVGCGATAPAAPLGSRFRGNDDLAGLTVYSSLAGSSHPAPLGSRLRGNDV